MNSSREDTVVVGLWSWLWGSLVWRVTGRLPWWHRDTSLDDARDHIQREYKAGR